MTLTDSMRDLLSVHHLRYSRIWIAMGVLFLAVIVFLSLTDIPEPVMSFMLHDKIMHGVAYAGLMFWFVQIFRHRSTRLMLAVSFITLGIGVEFLQAMVPSRAFELLDMAANVSGVILAWGLAHTRVGNALEWVERNCLVRPQPV